MAQERSGFPNLARRLLQTSLRVVSLQPKEGVELAWSSMATVSVGIWGFVV